MTSKIDYDAETRTKKCWPKAGVGKLLTRRATLEKNLEVKGRTNWKSKKRSSRLLMSYIPLYITKEQTLRFSTCFTICVYTVFL